ncbi:MAG TPA: DUF2934 domain-containing protein [Terriglobia bacterium]|nr:DUF2934 domain-containing protein [Terriglobia bacterium]
MGTSTKEGSVARPPAAATKLRIVYGEQLGALEEAIQKAIAYRAYEMYEAKGRSHGHDMEDWFDAERDLIKPSNIQITDAGSEIGVRAGVPGFQAEDIQIGVSSRKLIIWGQAPRPGAASRRNLLQMLAEIELPCAVDAKRSSATVTNETLDFKAAKQAPGAA